MIYGPVTGIIPCNRNAVTPSQPAPEEIPLAQQVPKDPEGHCPRCKRLTPCPDCFKVCSISACRMQTYSVSILNVTHLFIDKHKYVYDVHALCFTKYRTWWDT